MKESRHFPVIIALTAAALFGLNAPFSQMLLADISPMWMTALLYLGAGGGMIGLQLLVALRPTEAPLTRREMKWTVAMILLDVLAPWLLMWGLTKTTAANASLLFNFEIVATTLIATIFFHEAIGRRMWAAISVITLASIFLCLDFNDVSSWTFSAGSLLVLGACICWGLENNCTRNMSEKSPAQIVIIKGLGAGGMAGLLAWLFDDPLPQKWAAISGALILGFVAYGLSIFLYVKAQRFLGAARTSAYYAAAPFMGVLLSLLILRALPEGNFYAATAVMIIGVWLSLNEQHAHLHYHELLTHNHAHTHDDLHHAHHGEKIGRHTHEHTHAPHYHEHAHTPEIHHRHAH